MLAFAALLGLWKALGTNVLLYVVFVLSALAPIAILGVAWRSAYLVSLFAIYGPFVVMATYTLMFVECSHCKQTTWAMLPYGPGVIPLELSHHWLDMPRIDGALAYGVGFMLSAAFVSGLTWFVYTRGRWLRVLSLMGALLFFSYCAFVLLALIQA